jgi:hypothetical protein
MRFESSQAVSSNDAIPELCPKIASISGVSHSSSELIDLSSASQMRTRSGVAARSFESSEGDPRSH